MPVFSNIYAATIEEALAKKDTCLQIKNGEIKLKRNHSYYYQVQGQLNITKRSKCYFVVYINDSIDLFIEEKYKDEQFWKEHMLPELTRFYTSCIAPEIIRNNLSKNKKCVDPPYILDAIENRNKRRVKSIEQTTSSS